MQQKVVRRRARRYLISAVSIHACDPVIVGRTYLPASASRARAAVVAFELKRRRLQVIAHTRGQIVRRRVRCRSFSPATYQ
jgi:hypothetical protein